MNKMIFLILFMTSLSCSLIGVFLIFRNLSMVTDAISHSVLLGIVLAYFVCGDISSNFLIIGAAIFGLLTVFAIETLSSTGLVKNDDAVGIIFPLFFSLAVILISKYARNVHIDTDVVLMGEVILAPLNTVNILSIEVPKALISSSFILLINLTFITVFYKELKLTTFDPDFSTISGFSSLMLFYSLMALSSLTAVVSFDSVGAILVISFFIVPGATAFLLTTKLKNLLILSALFSLISSYLGFIFGYAFNVSMAGMTATVSGILFFLVLLFNKRGLITEIFLRRKNKQLVKIHLLLIYIGDSAQEEDAQNKLGFATINTYLNWDNKTLEKVLEYLTKKSYIDRDCKKKMYNLNTKGVEKYRELLRDYNLC